jgi:hypothetical protein
MMRLLSRGPHARSYRDNDRRAAIDPTVAPIPRSWRRRHIHEAGGADPGSFAHSFALRYGQLRTAKKSPALGGRK